MAPVGGFHVRNPDVQPLIVVQRPFGGDDSPFGHPGQPGQDARAVARWACARRAWTAAAGSSAPYTADPPRNPPAPASAQRSMVPSPTPPPPGSHTAAPVRLTSPR